MDMKHVDAGKSGEKESGGASRKRIRKSIA
ncbi:hypothetical protein EZS27_030933, partial [termite gut metagenome]